MTMLGSYPNCPDGHPGFIEVSQGIWVCLDNCDPPRVRNVWQFVRDNDPVWIKMQPDHWLNLQLTQSLYDVQQRFEQAEAWAARYTLSHTCPEIKVLLDIIRVPQRPGNAT